jgi:hypothetical protein
MAGLGGLWIEGGLIGKGAAICLAMLWWLCHKHLNPPVKWSDYDDG